MTAARAHGGGLADDSGSAVVEFVLVSVLLVVLALGIVQLALTLHVRNLMTSAAAEGARLAAEQDRSPAEGAERTSWLLQQSLGGDADVAVIQTAVDGAPVVEVTVERQAPFFGAWSGLTLTATAHAYKEERNG